MRTKRKYGYFYARRERDSRPEAALYLMLKMGYKRETIDLRK
jgi:hypothetical protein